MKYNLKDVNSSIFVVAFLSLLLGTQIATNIYERTLDIMLFIIPFGGVITISFGSIATILAEILDHMKNNK